MAMSGFFERLRQQVGFHRNDNFDGITLNRQLEREEEIDDFILVGNTGSEKTTVTADRFQSTLGSNAPPDYRQVSQDGLPSYDCALRGQYSISGGPMMFSQVQLSPVQDHSSLKSNSLGHKSPISDVPFQLHPTLRAQQNLPKLFQDIDLEPSQFNWEKYSHNFNPEHLCLRELNCGEEADISDFTQTPKDLNLASRSSEVEDLIKF